MTLQIPENFRQTVKCYDPLQHISCNPSALFLSCTCDAMCVYSCYSNE